MSAYVRQPLSLCTCKVCETKFMHINPRVRICGPQCKMEERRRARNRQLEKKKFLKASSTIKKTCWYCLKQFLVFSKRGVVHRKTCSSICQRGLRNDQWKRMYCNMTDQRKARRAEKHLQWERKKAATRNLITAMQAMENGNDQQP